MFENLWTQIAYFYMNCPVLSRALLVFAGLQIYYRVVVVKPTQLHVKQNSLYQVSFAYSIQFIWNNVRIVHVLFIPLR